MNIWENTVLTDQGKALQAKLIKGETLKIRRVTTGAGKVPVVDLRQQTSVTNGGYDIILQPARTDGTHTILPVLLENKGLKESYDLCQVGFYAEDPEEGEILFCLSQASQTKHIPSEAESPGFSITWDFYFNTSNTAPFEVVLNSAGSVNIEAFQVHTDEIQKINSTINSINSALYPIGIVLAFANGFDPNESLQGTWERIAKGQTLVGVDEKDPDFNAVGKPGGHKELQSHNHGSTNISGFFTAITGKNDSVNGIVSKGRDYATCNGPAGSNLAQREFNIKATIGTNSAGSGNTGNLQPYVTVFYWVRTL